jgi:hypothetical protein
LAARPEAIELSRPIGERWSRAQRMQEVPNESDFVIQVSRTFVEATFRPTGSVFIFRRYTNPKDIADFGPLSPEARIRAPTRRRGTPAFSSWEIQAMAFRLASEAARRVP